MRKALSIFLIFFLSFLLFGQVLAQENKCDNPGSLGLDDIQKCIDDLSKAKESSVTATRNLETQVTGIKNRVAFIENDLAKKAKSIQEGYKNLEKQQLKLNKAVRDYYIKSYYNSPLAIFLSSTSAENITQILTYQKKVADQDKLIITNIALLLVDLEKKKVSLELEQKSLTSVKADLDKVIADAKIYQGKLSGTIAELSAKQQAILAAKSGFTVNLGDSEQADDYNASLAGFRESAPAGSFGVFSIGAFTHRNGMSQYGALGRVKNKGSNYEELLKYYYPGIEIKKVDNPNISVYDTNSYGQTFNDESFPLEEYMKHIYEVPTSWPTEVLKAQAIAARSYAYGKSRICSGQGCQEFKREENSDAWKQAVKDTEGLIMSGGPGSFQYSSTTGGWINGGVGWDTTDGSGGSDFIKKTYESLAGSPWVYKAWYTKTYRKDSDKCGRSNAWLSNEEMADIVNAAIVPRDDRITPVTTSCWGGNPYSMQELRDKGGVTSISSVTVSQGNGVTNSVTFQTNKEDPIDIDSSKFKEIFKLRAPGYISIRQDGFSFFNIEKK